MDSRQTSTENPFSVLQTVLDSGERLPLLVESDTWIPTRVATRWAVRYRRLRVQASTLASNLRIIGFLYNWADTIGKFNLDDFLTQGNILNARQIESFASYLRHGRASNVRSLPDTHHISINIPSTYDHQLLVAADFLKWAIDHTNRGGSGILSLEELHAQRSYLDEIFKSLQVGTRPSLPQEPLTEEELKAIREIISPARTADGKLTFPKSTFTAQTQLRNWAMFETALELGIRRGELLKLRLDSLPRGNTDVILILRRPDDPTDSRRHEPAVKTAERRIPASQELRSILRAYLTAPVPMRRVEGKSPYLFVTEKGKPVSISTANDIMKDIRNMSGVNVNWHRLRHTWAEKHAERLQDEPNRLDQLMYLGGWTNESSPKRYIKNADAKQAEQKLREHQNSLYSEE